MRHFSLLTRLAGTFVLSAALLGCVSPSTSSYSAEGATLVDDPGQREVDITVGPIPVHAGEDHYSHDESFAFTVPMPVDGWFRSFEVRVVDADGSRLPDEMLHHLNLIVPNQRELFAPIMLRLAAASHETGRVQTPFRFGFPLQKADSLLIVAMLHNPTERTVDEAYAQVRIRYTPSSSLLPVVNTYPFYVDVIMEPGLRAFDLPPGRSELSWEGSPAVSGRILAVGAHLHRYATLLRFEDVTAGEVIWETPPIVDSEGNVVDMPVQRFLRRLGVAMRADHTYRLTAVYDNPTAETIPLGGMGVLGGAFVPSRRATWPEVDTADPEYLADRQFTIRGKVGGQKQDQGQRHHGHTHH